MKAMRDFQAAKDSFTAMHHQKIIVVQLSLSRHEFCSGTEHTHAIQLRRDLSDRDDSGAHARHAVSTGPCSRLLTITLVLALVEPSRRPPIHASRTTRRITAHVLSRSPA